MGEMAVPADALYGASTQRAVLNFPISGQRFPRRFIRALALIKLAAAETNARARAARARRRRGDRGGGPRGRRRRPRRPVPDRHLPDGLGNLDQHEHERGRRPPRRRPVSAGGAVHPNDEVNRCQSSNDTIPTALQLSAAMAIEDGLLPALERLHTALVAKEQELWPVVKTGRTHLQDATPIRLGQEFRGYAGQVEESIRRARAAQAELLAVPLGGHGRRDGDQRPPRVRVPDVRPAVRADRSRRPRDRRTTSTPRRRSTRRSRRTARSGRSRSACGRSPATSG